MKKIFPQLKFNKTDISSIFISFIIVNLAFLYHTFNFMWGNHDVKFIKERLYIDSGLFEGRFTQFIPHTFLTEGQILPIINNLIGFLFLTLGLWLLAKYWNIPKTRLNYILFITFFSTQPYTLSWLYFTFITISCLLWVFIGILGLYISATIYNSSNKFILLLLATICFYLTFGGYPPIINTYAVCILGKIIISHLYEKKSIIDIFKIHKYTIFALIIAVILYKITLLYLTPNNVYNLELSQLKDLPQKFLSTIKISFSQFFISQPFMGKGYKILLFTMSLCAIVTTIAQIKAIKQKFLIAVLIIGIIWSTSLTTFLVVPHTEYVSRIDFYGYAFLYVFFLGLLLHSKYKLSHSLALIFMIILIPLNILNDYHALKIWKQGFDSEMQILDRVVERIEEHPNFNPNKKYRLYQIGDISLRPNYYNHKYDINDVFMLTLPYIANWQGTNLLEFYSPYNYINKDVTIFPSDITPDVYEFFMHQAQPWPHKNSIFIKNDFIIITYHPQTLQEFKDKIKQLY